MHRELLNMYAVAWLFGGVGLIATVVYFVAVWRLRARGSAISARWDGVYCGFAVGTMIALFTCLIVAHHGPGLPHY